MDIYRHAKLVTIPQEVSFPRMCEIAHQKCLFGFFFPGSSNGLQPRPLNRFSRKIGQTTGSGQGCAFTGLENKNITFNPLIHEKAPFLARFWHDLQNFRPRIALQWSMGCSHGTPLSRHRRLIKLIQWQANWGCNADSKYVVLDNPIPPGHVTRRIRFVNISPLKWPISIAFIHYSAMD